MPVEEGPSRDGPGPQPCDCGSSLDHGNRLSLLDELKRDFQKVAPGMLIYSPEGVGKTTLATKFPNSAIVIHPDEDGVGDLKSAGLVPEDYPVFEVNNYEKLMGFLDLMIQQCPYRVLSFDTANTCLQRLLFEHVNRQFFNGEWKDFQNFDKGASRGMPEWETLLNKLTQLRRKGVCVILLAHAKTIRFKNPEGNDWMRYTPDIYESDRQGGPSFLNATKRWATDVGFMDFVVEVGEKGAKGKGGRLRRIRFNHDAAFDAKNRAGIKNEILLGFTPDEAYAKFVEAFHAAKKETVSH
jgi:hypothetical protein